MSTIARVVVLLAHERYRWMVGCERLPLLERSDQKLGADRGLSDNAIRKGNTSVTADVHTTNG